MKWKFNYHRDHDYLEVIVSESISSSELNQMAIERWDALLNLNCHKILFDFTRITNMLSIIDIYKRPEESEKVGVLRTNRTAAVVPEIYFKEFQFMETVYKNKGFDLNVFTKKEDALNYLAHAD